MTVHDSTVKAYTAQDKYQDNNKAGQDKKLAEQEDIIGEELV